MAFGTRYNVEIVYAQKYGRGAELSGIIQNLARSQGFLELDAVKRIIPEEEGRAYPSEKKYWIHMTKAHKGVEWRNSLIGINYNILGSKIDICISTAGENANDIWSAMVKELRNREDIKKIIIREIEQFGPGQSLRDGPIVVK